MAKLTWTLDVTAGIVTQDSPTISDANMDRFIDWCLYAYPQLDENGDPLPVTNAVKAAAFRDFARSQWQGVKANVLRWEQQEAAQAAREAVNDIEA